VGVLFPDTAGRGLAELECLIAMQWFWYLLEDISEQPLIMKAFLAWGWLSIVIMLAGMVQAAVS
jgi:hypothetical protein